MTAACDALNPDIELHSALNDRAIEHLEKAMAEYRAMIIEAEGP